jgi:hypothetical protein
MKKFVELSHPLRDGMQPYPGLPAPGFGAIHFLGFASSESAWAAEPAAATDRLQRATNLTTLSFRSSVVPRVRNSSRGVMHAGIRLPLPGGNW